MMNKSAMISAFAIASMTVSCSGSYSVAGVERQRIVVDSRYDKSPDAEAVAFLHPYKVKVDSIMSPVVGRTAKQLSSFRPESELSNLLADVLMWGAEGYHEHPDMAVYNIGGIRAALPKGEVTYGDVVDVAPFENKICFLTLKGSDLQQLFEQIAAAGGEGVSHGVKLVITRDGKLKSATLNGNPINPDASYRLATIDYLAPGNDGLKAFAAKTDFVSPQNNESNMRYVICNYLKMQQAKGQKTDADIEGRIVVE